MPSWLTCWLIQGEATGVEQAACAPAADVNSKKASKKKRKKCGVAGPSAVDPGQPDPESGHFCCDACGAS